MRPQRLETKIPADNDDQLKMGSCCTPAPAPGAEFPDALEGWQQKAIAAARAVSVKQLTGSYTTVT